MVRQTHTTQNTTTTFIFFSLFFQVSHFPAVKVHDVTFYHSYSNVCWSKNKTCLLGITPDTNETRKFGKQFFEEVFALPHQGSNLPRLEYFASEDTFRSTVDRDPANFYAGIVFKDTQNLQSYSLYMNSTLLPADNKATSSNTYNLTMATFT